MDGNLPQKQQEMLETSVALVAVAMVIYTIMFMRRHTYVFAVLPGGRRAHR